MIQIEVSMKDQVSEELGDFIATLTGEGLTELNQVGGRQATNAARDFHRDFSQRGGWKGKNYMQGTAGRSGEFGSNVSEGWSFRTADASGSVIGNNAEHYAFKVEGGTIRPKRASALTIPLIPEAKGRRAADYAIDFNTRLFRPKGTNVLMERVEGQTTGSRGRRGAAGGANIRTSQLRAVYALVKSVTMPPMPNAIPPLELLADEFTEGWIGALTDKIEIL